MENFELLRKLVEGHMDMDDMLEKLCDRTLIDIEEFRDLALAMQGSKPAVTEHSRLTVAKFLESEDVRRSYEVHEPNMVRIVCVATNKIGNPYLLTTQNFFKLIEECCKLPVDLHKQTTLMFYDVDYTKCDLSTLDTEIELVSNGVWKADKLIPFALSVIRGDQIENYAHLFTKVDEVYPGEKYFQLCEGGDASSFITTGDIDFSNSSPIYKVSDTGLKLVMWPECHITEYACRHATNDVEVENGDKDVDVV